MGWHSRLRNMILTGQTVYMLGPFWQIVNPPGGPFFTRLPRIWKRPRLNGAIAVWQAVSAAFANLLLSIPNTAAMRSVMRTPIFCSVSAALRLPHTVDALLSGHLYSFAFTTTAGGPALYKRKQVRSESRLPFKMNPQQCNLSIVG
jgi:hypothetical protein